MLFRAIEVVDVTEFSLDSKFIRGCDIPPQPSKIEPLALVIFGGAGDLAGRKLMPMLFNLYRQGEITYEDALANAESANEARLMVKLGTEDAGRPSRGAVDGQQVMETSSLVQRIGLVNEDEENF